jgi:hypothetical protein
MVVPLFRYCSCVSSIRSTCKKALDCQMRTAGLLTLRRDTFLADPGRARARRKPPIRTSEWARQMAYINHFYLYLWDSHWGAAFWETNAYAPYPIWLWLNGHQWAKRQLEKARIAYEALDNGWFDGGVSVGRRGSRLYILGRYRPRRQILVCGKAYLSTLFGLLYSTGLRIGAA